MATTYVKSSLFRLALVLALVSSLFVAADITGAPSAEATHLRSSQLTWRATGPTTAEFESTIGVRRSFFGSPNVGDTITPISIFFGDGSSTAPPHTVVAVDAANDWILTEGTFSQTYASAGPFTAFGSVCCRLSGPLHRNNPDANNRVETVVDFASTTASPVSSISPIVDCPIDAVCQFVVPAVDADGQGLRFRFATPFEATGTSSFNQPGPPQAPNAATVDASSGLYSWDTTGASLNPSGDSFYSTQVIVENVVGTTVVSKTAVDFFIRLTTSPNQAPLFVAPTPADGTVINTTVGSLVSFDVAADDPDAGDTVTLSMLGKPGDATYTTTSGNPATGTFSWTPTATGSVILTLTAQDQNGLGATQRSITINVTDAVTDTTAPDCALTAMHKGPPASIEVTTQDSESGLASIEVTKSVNLTTNDVTAFTVGTTDMFVVTATKIDSSKKAQLELRVTDVAGNVTVCDPVHVLEVRQAGEPVSNVYDDIPEEEGVVDIMNNDPGVQRLDVNVNGTTWRVSGLRNGENRTLDVSSAMVAGNDNTVTLTAYGRPGGSVDVLIWDGNQP